MQNAAELWKELAAILAGQPRSATGEVLLATSLRQAVNHIRLRADGFETTGETEKSTTRHIQPADIYYFARLAMESGCVELKPEMISETRNGSICCSVLNLHPDFKYIGKPQRLYYLPLALRPELR